MSRRDIILPRFYLGLASTFIAASAVALLATLYFVWARVTISIVPIGKDIELAEVLTVQEGTINALQDGVVAGKIQVVEMTDKKIFSASGSKQQPSDVSGEVTIINNYSKEQTLIATTRLASASAPQTVVARLSRTVTLQSHTQLRVPITAENPDTLSSFADSRLIIPGLWGPLQEHIYAQTDASFGRGPQQIAFVTDQDLQTAAAEMKDALYQQAVGNVNQGLAQNETLWPKLVTVDSSDMQFDAAAGEETSEFTGTMTLKAVVVAFDENQVIAQVRKKIKSTLPADQQVGSVDPKNFTYSLQGYDLEKKTAEVKANVVGRAVASSGEEIVDKYELIGLTEQEVVDKLLQTGAVESVTVTFFPSWLKKTPRILGKIDLVIAQ